MKQEILI